MPIVLSLVSHTNAGKTTLLRTLLRRDVGEVGDRAHVTVEATCYSLIEMEDGSALHLWDTPGFGANLAKLASRIRAESNPIGWLLHQVWDRHRDPSLFHSQTALRNVRDHADIVVYIVDLSQNPAETGYVDAELGIIDLMNRPAIVALNHLGPVDPAEAGVREEEIRALVARHPSVRQVVALDAFTRCWVQEHRLLDLAVDLVAADRKAEATRLVGAWRERQLGIVAGCAARLTRLFAESAADSEAFSEAGWFDRLRQLVNRLARHAEFERLQKAMYQRLRDRTESAVNDLIALHGIDGTTARKFAADARDSFTASGGKVDAVLTSIGGGAVSGLIGGIALDLASHGISFGSGAAIGAILGGATSYALARGYNLTQGDSKTVRWTEHHFREQVAFCLSLYLAVAHFGRGRGAWLDSQEDPKHWSAAVDSVVQARLEEISALWRRGKSDEVAELESRYRQAVESWLQELVIKLYPDAKKLFR